MRENVVSVNLASLLDTSRHIKKESTNYGIECTERVDLRKKPVKSIVKIMRLL